MAGLIDQRSRAASDQERDVVDVSRSPEATSAVTQHKTTTVGETAASVWEISALSTRLRRSISSFSETGGAGLPQAVSPPAHVDADDGGPLLWTPSPLDVEFATGGDDLPAWTLSPLDDAFQIAQ